jgi:hypothetical protein
MCNGNYNRQGYALDQSSSHLSDEELSNIVNRVSIFLNALFTVGPTQPFFQQEIWKFFFALSQGFPKSGIDPCFNLVVSLCGSLQV